MSRFDRAGAEERDAVRLAGIADRLEAAGLLVSRPAQDIEVTGISDDSRRVRPGDLYCAWQGTAVDGHTFVVTSEAAGAVAALVERPVVDASLTQVLVTDGRRAAAIAASVVLRDPQEALRLVGVTGTNGKTTTVWILRHLLGTREPTASLGTLGVILEDGSPLPGMDNLTTPGPVELGRTLRLLLDRGVRTVVMETSSHALHQGRVEAMRFDAGVFTNLSRDHLDYHGTLELYRAAKLSLCDLLKPNGWAVINADDAAWAVVAEQVDRTLSFGMEASAAVRACDVTFDRTGSRFTVEYGGARAAVHLPLLGAFNVQNALAATSTGLALGMRLDDVAATLADVPQVPGRLERIATRPCPVLRDYAHTPDALQRSLSALRPLTRGRLIVVFGAGGDRDRGKRPLMGAVAQRGADVVIVTSDNPRTEDPDAILFDIIGGMTDRGYTRIVDRREAIAYALASAKPDDLVLLAGKGHETYQIVGTRKLPFDERLIVDELLLRGARQGATPP